VRLKTYSAPTPFHLNFFRRHIPALIRSYIIERSFGQRENLFMIEHDLLKKSDNLAQRFLPPWDTDRINAPIGNNSLFLITHPEIENSIFTLYLRKYLKERIRKDD